MQRLGIAKSSKEKMSLEIFYKKVTKGLLANAVIQKFQAQGQTNTPANRLIGREQFIYRIPVTQSRLERKSQCVCVQRETSARPGKL
jgi:hypothetical protein